MSKKQTTQIVAFTDFVMMFKSLSSMRNKDQIED